MKNKKEIIKELEECIELINKRTKKGKTKPPKETKHLKQTA